MYFVKYGNEYLHDPRSTDYILLDLTLECEQNTCGYCDFTIYPNHPMYGKIEERNAANPIRVYDNDTLLFAGFIYELGKEFYLDGQVRCKGDLAYLNESIVRPYSTTKRDFGGNPPASVDGYFNWLIEQHNAQVPVSKRFTVGINQGRTLQKDLEVHKSNNACPNTLEEILYEIIDIYGGYLRIRYENDIRYIDLLYEWTEENSQILDFGVNLTDYSQVDNSSELATYVVPLGANLHNTKYTYNDGYFKTSDTTPNSTKTYYTKNENVQYSMISNLTKFEPGVTYYENGSNGYFETKDTTPNSTKTYYTKNVSNQYYMASNLSKFESGVTYYEYDVNKDESGQPLTVEDRDNVYTYTNEDDYKKTSDYIYCESAVAKYGLIGTTYSNPDILTKEELIKEGIAHLKKLISPKRTIDIRAVDMHLINPNLKPIKVGEYVRVRSKPHNFDSYMLCTRIDLNLNNPEISEYSLGSTFDTLTGEQNKRIKALNTKANKQIESATAFTDEVKAMAQDASKTAIQAEKAATEAVAAANSAILSVVEEYATSSTPTAKPTGDWSTESPEYSTDSFIWRRVVVTYGDGTVVTGEPVLTTGNSGEDGEDAALLRIESSRGTVFKNNSISTVLSVVIYKGSLRITDKAGLTSAFGSGAYLQWSWQRIDENIFGVISADDKMLSNNGFALTISADEVDTKVTFMCELII